MILNEVEKLSPVRIEYRDNYPYQGSYYSSIKLIAVKTRIDKVLQAVVLLHEIGHAICDAANCECRKKGAVLREYHAIKYTMEHIVDKAEMIKMFVPNIIEVSHFIDFPDHRIAIKQIMKLKQWKKFYKIARKK